jgi:phage-related protein
MAGTIKPTEFVGSSLDDLRGLSEEMQGFFGFAIYEAQLGGKSPHAKPLKGFGGAAVLEIVDNDESGTYRAVYTVKFAGVIYVLHVFQKKSKKGTATPKPDMDTIKSRLVQAKAHYDATYKVQSTG